MYNFCDILLLPSCREGFGYAVAEAMACGKPVICTNSSSLPELVMEGKGGFLCEQDNIEDFVVHPTAVIEQPCAIGPRTKIWHFSHVMAGAVIGADCVLGQNTFVASTARVGDRVKIQNNVSVYDGVELEDEVFCGPSVVFTNVVNPRSAASRKNEFQKTLVREGATLGANATIRCGLSVGRYAFVGAGSVVTKEVPDHALVYGNPARLKGGICRCAMKLEKRGRRWICPSCDASYGAGKEGLVAARQGES